MTTMNSPRQKETSPQGAPNRLFRADAVAHSANHSQDEGHLLTIFPRWIRITYWLILLLAFDFILFIIGGTISEYATGPALIWFKDRQDLTVKKAGTVKSIEVLPGQKVRAGTTLVRLYDAQETVDLKELQQEFDLLLVNYLRDLQNEVARQSLNSLRARRDRAAALLEERLIKAPTDSIVTDLRIRLGQHVAEGESVVSLAQNDEKCSALILLPGHFRPQLRAGMELRMEMDGYRFAYHHFIIDDVTEQVIGPSEVQRYIGAELRDSVPAQGPTVLVWAHPVEKTFSVDGQTYSYHHGMVGKADVLIAKERIILTLLPALRRLF